MATHSRKRRRRRGGRGRSRGPGGNDGSGRGGSGRGGSGGGRGRGGRGRRSGGGNSSDSNFVYEEAGLLVSNFEEKADPPAPDAETPFEAPSVEQMYGFGVLDAVRDGHGFLRQPDAMYEKQDDDAYVPQQLIRTYGLRNGVTIDAELGDPRSNGQNPQLIAPHSICGMAPHLYHQTPHWGDLTVIDPDRPLLLSQDSQDTTLRIIDMLCPIGFGQRGLLVSPPRAGKTMILQKIAQSVQKNHPDAYLIVLLVDERPEEATAFQRTTTAEVAVSTNDNPPESHVNVTEMVLRKAKRMVETGRDVVILMDSLTRLGRAYNLLQRGGGRTMSGGMDSRTLEKPKAFFGAARNIENGGSLTIVATALIDTGSRMDQVIFEEFKGTGNMELVLDRALAEQRIFPAIDVGLSGTRKEEKLIPHETLEKIYRLRRLIDRVGTAEAMELLINRLDDTPTNDAFLDMLEPKRRDDMGFDSSW